MDTSVMYAATDAAQAITAEDLEFVKAMIVAAIVIVVIAIFLSSLEDQKPDQDDRR